MTKRLLLTGALTAMVTAGVVVATTAPASAYVACNNEGDCWHTDTRIRVPGITLGIHPDDWYFHQTWNGNRHFRDYHEGRGYYRNGIWITL